MISIDEHFSQVGQLFYAIAICDGNLHDQELRTLRDTLIDYRDIIIARNDSLDISKVPSVEEIITTASKESLDSWAYFSQFKNYYELNPEEFSRELKDHILTGIKRIASSYAQQNKSEIVLLAKIRLLFSPL